MKSKTLPSVRIESKTDELMQMALKRLNAHSLVLLSLQDFRRICYEFTSQKIVQGEKIKLHSH